VSERTALNCTTDQTDSSSEARGHIATVSERTASSQQQTTGSMAVSLGVE
jgi:hypothetical protein